MLKKKYALTADWHPIVQASLAYGFVQVASIIYDIYPLNQQGRLTILPNVFGVMGAWYDSKTRLYVANVDGYTNFYKEGGKNMNFQCKKCNSKKYFLDRVGVHVGLYCADCGTWQKWLNKQEYRLFKRFSRSE
jgi:hypothetical protein